MSDEQSGYQRWRTWIEDFAGGADYPPAGLAPMADLGGSLALPRLVRHCDAALAARMARWTAALQRDLAAVQAGRGEHLLTAAEQALVRARRALEPILAFVRSPLLLAELRDALTSAVETAITEFQENTEREVRKGGRGNEAFLRVVLHTPLTAALHRPAPGSGLPAPGGPASGAPASGGPAAGGPRRRVVLGTGDRPA